MKIIFYYTLIIRKELSYIITELYYWAKDQFVNKVT